MTRSQSCCHCCGAFVHWYQWSVCAIGCQLNCCRFVFVKQCRILIMNHVRLGQGLVEKQVCFALFVFTSKMKLSSYYVFWLLSVPSDDYTRTDMHAHLQQKFLRRVFCVENVLQLGPFILGTSRTLRSWAFSSCINYQDTLLTCEVFLYLLVFLLGSQGLKRK